MGKRPCRRGHRSALAELARLPEWGRNLVGVLRSLPEDARRGALRALRTITFLLESEWGLHAQPVREQSGDEETV